MGLRLKTCWPSPLTALMAVIVSFVLQAVIPSMGAAALLALIITGGIAAGVGYFAGGALARTLTDLNNVILRFIKWDMDGVVPHAGVPTRSAASPKR
jgi:hypothetical protein